MPVEGLPGVKVATIEAPGRTLCIVAISGLGNADPVIKRLIAGDDMGFDLVEIMACPGGCINGAGHPKPLHQGEEGLRSMVLANIDADALASLGGGASGVAAAVGTAGASGAPQTLLAQGTVGGECRGGNC